MRKSAAAAAAAPPPTRPARPIEEGEEVAACYRILPCNIQTNCEWIIVVIIITNAKLSWSSSRTPYCYHHHHERHIFIIITITNAILSSSSSSSSSWMPYPPPYNLHHECHVLLHIIFIMIRECYILIIIIYTLGPAPTPSSRTAGVHKMQNLAVTNLHLDVIFSRVHATL